MCRGNPRPDANINCSIKPFPKALGRTVIFLMWSCWLIYISIAIQSTLYYLRICLPFLNVNALRTKDHVSNLNSQPLELVTSFFVLPWPLTFKHSVRYQHHFYTRLSLWQWAHLDQGLYFVHLQQWAHEKNIANGQKYLAKASRTQTLLTWAPFSHHLSYCQMR